VPRKGGILKREYWMDYLPTREGKFPDMDFVCVSVDSSFTEKEENDPTGCTTWGLWTDPEDGFPKVMLLAAWRKKPPDPRRRAGASGAHREHGKLPAPLPAPLGHRRDG
jgi:hypothetical protein